MHSHPTQVNQKHISLLTYISVIDYIKYKIDPIEKTSFWNDGFSPNNI